MRVIGTLLTLVLAGTGNQAAIPYFSHMSEVTHVVPGHQNYFALDAQIWKTARPDLADLRLYDGHLQVPYVLRKQTADSSHEESAAKILNLGSVGGHTEFDLDARGMGEYNRVRLNLDAKNFICTGQVQGRQNAGGHSGAELGTTTLYNFTTEGLGSNFVLKFPAATFPYLHVRFAPGIRPDQIKGAYITTFSEAEAVWVPAGICAATSGPPKQSIFECSISLGMPVERVAFQIEPDAVNFNRAVVVSSEKGEEVERGSISRVRVTRAGHTVSSEELAIDLHARTESEIRVTIENGDDRPLPVRQVQALSVERRVYFDPAQGKTTLRLYYGDQKLEAPAYDYGKFFQPSAEATVAQLRPEEANNEFTGRPDERPWSERHRIVLWAAMVIAVALLGTIAIRGFVHEKQQSNSKSPQL